MIRKSYCRSLIAIIVWTAVSTAHATPINEFTLGRATNSSVVVRAQRGAACGVIYDTTHASLFGAEIANPSFGPATCMGDKIVLAGSEREICDVTVDVYSMASTQPFSLTLELYTDCITNGGVNTACGSGPGTLIPGSTVTVNNVTPPGLGIIVPVTFSYPGGLDLSGESDNTISVKILPSRSDVFWRIDETPSVGSTPAGEPSNSYVERCGSVTASNGCSRNFGVNNNFAITITAAAGPIFADSFE